MNEVILHSILWWTAALLSGSIAYRYFYDKHGHGLRAEFPTLGVIAAVIVFGTVVFNAL